ncbi:hypothetical protein [Amycolatopsis palatopharyngis]|uniref:hypothetical protein n=1 Tax=Amycolatopsis palatopharyngis TaxID=187982 RepID=UPI0013BE9CAE|nr:hypothetical protein [Amycolatopsis palatopharyngis]
MIDTGQVAWTSMGSGPHVQTVAGVGVDEGGVRRRDGAGEPGGREVARARRTWAAVVVCVRAPG